MEIKEKAFTGEAVYFIYSRKSSYQSIKDILVWFYGSRENSNRDVLLAAIEKKILKIESSNVTAYHMCLQKYCVDTIIVKIHNIHIHNGLSVQLKRPKRKKFVFFILTRDSNPVD